MRWTLTDPIIDLDLGERTFVAEGSLPSELEEAMDELMREGLTPTQVWGDVKISFAGLDDNMLVVESAYWVDRRIKMCGRIEGPR